MDRTALTIDMPSEDQRLAETIRTQQRRLRRFVQARVADVDDAEDILQDVFYELIEAVRLMKPVEQAGAWLFRVARNRITDLYRKRRPTVSMDAPVTADDAGPLLEDWLPSPTAGPDAAYARSVLLEEIAAAIDELPNEQRAIFLAHEVEGRSFKELAAETGLSVNTLLARKRYAVLKLRRRLQVIYDEFYSRGDQR